MIISIARIKKITVTVSAIILLSLFCVQASAIGFDNVKAVGITEAELEQGEQDKILREIHHELTHRFDSRFDLANGVAAPFKDTAIGYALEADRKLELGAVAELPARLDALEAKIDRLIGGGAE